MSRGELSEVDIQRTQAQILLILKDTDTTTNSGTHYVKCRNIEWAYFSHLTQWSIWGTLWTKTRSSTTRREVSEVIVKHRIDIRRKQTEILHIMIWNRQRTITLRLLHVTKQTYTAATSPCPLHHPRLVDITPDTEICRSEMPHRLVDLRASGIRALFAYNL